jgi:hypothetical protein
VPSAVSARTLDRLLAPLRAKTGRHCGTRPGSLLRQSIPKDVSKCWRRMARVSTVVAEDRPSPERLESRLMSRPWAWCSWPQFKQKRNFPGMNQ